MRDCKGKPQGLFRSGGATLSDTAFDFNTPITKDITLYAKWAVNAVTHTVSFDTKGGSDVASQTIVHGNKATKPADPTKEGSTFKGWFVGDTEFDFTTPITGTLEITAKWFAGTKKPDAQKAVVDIVFADGSATPYTSGLTLTDEQKENSIAIIYKADGSDNLSEIKAFLEKNDKTEDDTYDLTRYPAFEFAINYKDKEGSHVKNTDFEDGWYLPSLAELYDIWTQKSTVNEACKLCTGKSLEDDAKKVDSVYEAAYLSSTPSSINNGQYIIFKEDNKQDVLLSRYVCNFPGNVCCIRFFN